MITLLKEITPLFGCADRTGRIHGAIFQNEDMLQPKHSSEKEEVFL